MIIDAPGNYKLCEDISFSPGLSKGATVTKADMETLFDPDFSKYDPNSFGLGFFAAIAITADDVTLFLNGCTIEQSVEHALMQRFFAVIELASAPFIPSVGPAQFVGATGFKAAKNVKILGPGTIGRSSHHGIHGNDNVDVEISGIVFEDFEVAAVSLNNVDNLLIEDNVIPHNRQDVPVLGMFSSARLIRPYGKKLADEGFNMMLRGQGVTAAEVYDALLESIFNVFSDVRASGEISAVNHAEDYGLYNNRFRAVDGPCYAFLVHGKGPAVGGHGDVFAVDETTTSSNVIVRNNDVSNIKCWVNEVPATVSAGAVMNDVRGAVFQMIRASDSGPIARNLDGTYKGNVVADMQIMVAKAVREGALTDEPGAQIGPNTIGSALIEWAEDGTTVFTPKYRCNGDSMHHVSKGMIMFRIEDSRGFEVTGNKVSDILNLSPPPFEDCTDYHGGASEENSGVTQNGDIRGISIAASRGFADRLSIVADNTITGFTSAETETIIGIDVQGDTKDIAVDRNVVNLSSAGENPADAYVALRVREQTSGVVVGTENVFSQEVEILARRRVLRKNPHGHVADTDGSEWRMGGCPFAHMAGRARRAEL